MGLHTSSNMVTKLGLLVLVLVISGVIHYIWSNLEDLHHHYGQALVAQLLGKSFINLLLAKGVDDRQRELKLTLKERNNSTQKSVVGDGEGPVDVFCGEDGDWINATWVSKDCATSRPQCKIQDTVQRFKKERRPRLIFLGDSTIKHLAETMRTYFSNGAVTKNSDICHTIEVLLMMERASFWSPPSSREGPLKNGLENHFCSDCSGCWGFVFESPAIDIEYIPVEFAKDVELQTEDTRTTQETIAKYLKSSTRETILLVNTGLHDCAFQDFNFAVYEQNLASYLRLLTAIEHVKVVWIHTNAVLGIPVFPQQNDRIYRMNQLAVKVCDYVGVTRIVNTFDMSKHEWATQNLFVDNVHLLKRRKLYYRTVSNIIITHIVCPYFFDILRG